jgi:geranylgeranyl pyrophosphate synthase
MKMPPTVRFERERTLIEHILERLVRANPCPGAAPVAEAMEYAVMGGGQRLRPLLALQVGQMTGADESLVLKGAAGVELLHCASLIVDDLPCMDDELMRCGRPAVHRQFGEANAVLAAFSLVALAARQCVEGICEPATLQAMSCFQQSLLRVLDCNSLVGGQALDLAQHRTGPASSRRLAELKTAPLFVLSARAGLLGSRVAGERARKVVQFGHEFGVAYQMLDDLRDGELQSADDLWKQVNKACQLIESFPGRDAVNRMTEMFHAAAVA